MAKQEERKLSKAIENDYELIGIQPGEIIIQGQKYDFRTMPKAVADKLYATDSGKKYMKLKKASPAAKQV